MASAASPLVGPPVISGIWFSQSTSEWGPCECCRYFRSVHPPNPFTSFFYDVTWSDYSTEPCPVGYRIDLRNYDWDRDGKTCAARRGSHGPALCIIWNAYLQLVLKGAFISEAYAELTGSSCFFFFFSCNSVVDGWRCGMQHTCTLFPRAHNKFQINSTYLLYDRQSTSED